MNFFYFHNNANHFAFGKIHKEENGIIIFSLLLRTNPIKFFIEI